jgi:two-component system, OmpR family, sensor kinase
MRLTLRGRVVLAACAAIVIAVVLVAIGVSVLVERQLRGNLDSSLRDRAAEVARLSVSAPSLLATPGALDTSIGGLQLSIEVLDRHGRVLARSLSLGGSFLPAGLAGRVIADGRASYASGRLGDTSLRLYVAPLPAAAGTASGGAVIVGGSTDDITDTLDRLHLFAALCALVAAALAGVVSFLLVRRALRPLETLSVGAAEIERTGDTSRRLPDPRTPDEVGRLAGTLNRMLVALDRARILERRFLSDASHELRTPVTALRGNIDYVRRHGPDPVALEDLAGDAARLSELVDNLLTLSREDEAATVEQDDVRLDLLAREAAAVDSRIVVDAPQAVRVRGDSAALLRALENLVENARRYGPAMGTITVTAREGDGLAHLSVRDDGPGLLEDEADQAFERFWRKDRSTPGSGLGLAIVKATAERHGGRATVKGSEFTIELPAFRDFSKDGGTTNGDEARKGRP